MSHAAGAHRKASVQVNAARSTKLFWQGTHRVADPRASAARIGLHSDALGITRVADVTGLDRIGIPVVMVVRPASRNLSVVQGKGLTADTALASGLGEAVESFCSERIAVPDRIATIEAARKDSAHLVLENLMRREPSPGTPIPWSECTDLFSGRKRNAPSELVYADFSAPPPNGQGYFNVSTNGLAAGNSRDEALLHALCEVVERDAVALWLTGRHGGRTDPPLDHRSLKDGECLRLLSLLDAAGLWVDIWDVSSDLGVPAFLCAIDDRDEGASFCVGRIVGSGCHPSASVALCRAITEAAQARLTIIVGARDDLDFDLYRLMGLNALFARSASHSSRALRTPFEDRSFATDDIAEDLRLVLARLSAAGIETVLAGDLSCPVAGFSCVRVLAPELESLYEKSWYRPGDRARAIAKSLE